MTLNANIDGGFPRFSARLLALVTQWNGRFLPWQWGIPPRCWFAVAATIAAVGVPARALAFKVETHVWIAQQVINDLAKEDQSLTFVVGSTERISVPVTRSVRAAILAFPETFRMGSIGPDAFPGIYEGQMTIHPGAALNKKQGWGTGEWLTHVLRMAKTPEEIAFAYGMLTHAAADIFAHTYVNMYAGDYYLLTDKEVDVEARHFLLEGYIAGKMPVMLDPNGSPISSISGSLRRNGKLAVPVDFLWRVFVNNEIAANQFSSNYSPHIAAVYELHRDLIDLSRSGGTLERMNVLSQQIVIYWYTEYKVDSEYLIALNAWHEKFNGAKNKGIDVIESANGEFVKLFSSGRAAAAKQHRAELERAQAIFNEVVKARQQVASAEQEVINAASELGNLQDEVGSKLVERCNDAVETVCTERKINPPCGKRLLPKCIIRKFPPGCGVVKRTCSSVDEPFHIVNPKRVPAKQSLDAMRLLEGLAVGQLNKQMDEYIAAMEALYQAERSVVETHLVAVNASLELIKKVHLASDPITGLTRGWAADIGLSMSEYFVANGQAMANAMDGGNVIAPLEAWVDCSAPAIMGIPSEIVDVKCSASQSIHQINEALDALVKVAANIDPVTSELLELREKVKAVVVKAGKDAITKMASKIIGVDVKRLMEVVQTKPTKALLDAQFSADSSSKNLITFARVSDSVDKEMRLVEDKLNPDKFEPIYNAVVLSKLAMLDAAALNTIIGKPGLFSAEPLEKSNIILEFASAIDGNHQWRGIPPGYPRKNADPQSAPVGYGYSCFAMWGDLALRKRVFNGLFKGPLSPGLEAPKDFNIDPAIPVEYYVKNYPVTIDDPYPGDACDK